VKLKLSCLVPSLLVISTSLMQPALAAEHHLCDRTIQGNIPWDYSGHTRWNQDNIDRLCTGAEDTQEPARCFDMSMDRGIDKGAGPAWGWREGIDLCAGTRDHLATINCFRSRIRSGLPRSDAMAACRWSTPSTADGTTAAPTLPLPALRKLPAAAPQSTWSLRSAHISRATQLARAAINPPLGAVAGLSEFELLFPGPSDHKIRHIAVLAADRFAEFAFGDQGGEDAFNADGRWVTFSSGQAGTVSAAGSGRLNLTLDPGPPNTTLVLTGFEFTRAAGTDANVRMLGIRLLPGERTAQVWLIDDMGFDFRDIGNSAGWAAIGGLFLPPVGSIIAGAASAPAAQPGNMRPFHIKLQYAWIPKDLIESERSATDTTAFNTLKTKPGGTVVLQGFEFAFGNSDHHLGGLGVTLGGDHHNVLFRDSDWGDPVQWAVSYGLLKRDRQR